ncbi:MAG TPA: methyltransferase domain-containing protein [Lacunisphaera sp.]|nr:methyltransferase domain-containing protein [Lacunisphaera sp.]
MTLDFRLALILSGASGFIALAHEIVWSRVYNLTSGSSAQALGMMLGGYLVGLALGSLLSRRWQDERYGGPAQLRTLARLVLGANVAAFLLVPAISWLVVWLEWPHTLPLLAGTAALLGAGFPLLCHLAIPADRESGARLSYLYLANIVGSGLGSLLTGFGLMQWFALWQIAAGLLVAAVGLAGLVARLAGPVPRRDAALCLVALLLATTAPQLYAHLYERLQYKAEALRRPPFTEVIESRHGVITIEDNRVIYGSGIYDGLLDTSPRTGGGLYRPYFISALHPAPREVLVVGMSGGAWAKVIAHNPGVDKVTVVEISEGYLQLIARHRVVSDLLTDPKVTIAIDDGRRWLRRHPDRRFDVVVMNTTFYWREFASAILSRECLELVKAHLKPGGFVMWNCTGSDRAIKTGMEVFPHTLMLGNNCVGSEAPLAIDADRWRSVLAAYRMDGRPVFDLATPAGRADLEAMLAIATDPQAYHDNIQNRAQMAALYGGARIITDDNLGHEYKFTLTDTARLRQLLFLDRR